MTDNMAQNAAAPAYRLVVKEAFGSYAKGDIIQDAAAIAAVLDGGYEWCVVRILPDAL